MKKYYTCEEVAARLGVRVATVWTWVRTGKLVAYKIGRIYRIDEEDLTMFLKEGVRK